MAKSKSHRRRRSSKRRYSRRGAPPVFRRKTPCPPGYVRHYKSGECVKGKDVPAYKRKSHNKNIYNKRTGKRITVRFKYRTLSEALRANRRRRSKSKRKRSRSRH